MGISAALAATAAVAGAAITSHGATQAANTQASAARDAQATQMQMYQQTRSDLAPYMTTGSAALSQLAQLWGLSGPGGGAGGLGGGSGGAGGLGGAVDWNAFGAQNPDVMQWAQTGHGDPSTPIDQQSLPQRLQYWYQNAGRLNDPRGSQPLPMLTAGSPVGAGGATSGLSPQLQALTQFPGYQFGMDQGIQAIQRSAAARGGLLNGGTLQDLTKFGVNYGLSAGWQPYVSELNGLVTNGQNAAAGVGTNGLQTGAGIAGNQLAAGQATASGQVGTANSLTGALNNSLLAYQLNSGGGYGASPITGSQADFLNGGGADFGSIFGGG